MHRPLAGAKVAWMAGKQLFSLPQDSFGVPSSIPRGLLEEGSVRMSASAERSGLTRSIYWRQYSIRSNGQPVQAVLTGRLPDELIRSRYIARSSPD